MAISCCQFGNLTTGEIVERITLTNRSSMTVELLTYGAIIHRLTTNNAKDDGLNITLGYDELIQYEYDTTYQGAIIGRCSNRISDAKFKINGEIYRLDTNSGYHHLHGGNCGLHKKLWKLEEQYDSDEPAIVLSCISSDSESGYPGNVEIKTTYRLTQNNRLEIILSANTDKTTIMNLTNHAYFNLSGNISTAITNHHICINADHFTPVNKSLIPTGEIRDVTDTPFDLRESRLIADVINQNHEQLHYGNGFDHNWVVKKNADELTSAASVCCEQTGIRLNIFTTQPGIQFYTGNQLTGKFQPRSGFCLEAQALPDSPNHSNFSDIVLKPEETYRETIVYEILA